MYINILFSLVITENISRMESTQQTIETNPVQDSTLWHNCYKSFCLKEKEKTSIFYFLEIVFVILWLEIGNIFRLCPCMTQSS